MYRTFSGAGNGGHVVVIFRMTALLSPWAIVLWFLLVEESTCTV